MMIKNRISWFSNESKTDWKISTVELTEKRKVYQESARTSSIDIITNSKSSTSSRSSSRSSSSFDKNSSDRRSSAGSSKTHTSMKPTSSYYQDYSNQRLICIYLPNKEIDSIIKILYLILKYPS